MDGTGKVRVHDVTGQYIADVNVCGDGASIASIAWHDGMQRSLKEGYFNLGIAFSNGKLQLMRYNTNPLCCSMAFQE
jgi:hypothetical protein